MEPSLFLLKYFITIFIKKLLTKYFSSVILFYFLANIYFGSASAVLNYYDSSLYIFIVYFYIQLFFFITFFFPFLRSKDHIQGQNLGFAKSSSSSSSSSSVGEWITTHKMKY